MPSVHCPPAPYALARRPGPARPGVTPLAADLTDADSLRRAVAGTKPTHVFLAAWVRKETEAEKRAPRYRETAEVKAFYRTNGF